MQATFSAFGKVVSAKVQSNRRGKAKGFGYVEMEDSAAAQAAVESLRGKELNGRLMDVVLEEKRGRPQGGGRRR